ncbi:unnamed protein product [Spirodela intermedia]|uniref:Calmodulin-binding domain-containing protein n=1 Tax=Spirodela intermedia TaxID=51605 RepID=A0A7I8LDX6_SPIIN|nr:unnamed protein product [Spirodela intermedia]
MATTRKDVVPGKERAGRSSLSRATIQNPRPRPTRPSSSSSEKDVSPTSPKRTTAPNYLKPTFSSSPETSKTARPPQKSLSVKKTAAADGRAPPLRSSSFNAPRQVKTTPLPSKATFFSERTTKRKVTSSALKSEIPSAEGKTRDKDSRPSSANPSAAGSTKAAPPADEETLSCEDKESALDILNLDVEEHVLVEISSSPERPTHLEDAEEVTTAMKGAEVGHGDEDEGNKSGDGEETTREEEEAPGEEVEKLHAEKSGGEDDDRATEHQETDGGEDGEQERMKPTVEDKARGKEKGNEAAPPQGKKEAPPAYNDVIEETASKLAEKRKSKVLALVGAFETVISLDSGGQAQ